MKQTLRIAIPAIAFFVTSRAALAQDMMAKEGRFGAGVGVVPLEVGPVEAFSAGGHGLGVRLAAGAQIDLDPRWALRIPVVVAGASAGTNRTYAEIAIVPGVIYRFRDRTDEALTPYVGVGFKLGGFGADRPLLGKPLIATVRQGLSNAHPFEEHHGSSDPNFDTEFGVGGELWLGLSWHMSRLFSLDLSVTGSLVRLDGVFVGYAAETGALRLTF